jgi:hypothetical protein
MRTKISCLLSFVAVFCGISGCDESTEIQNWVENTSKLRLEAENRAKEVPYRQPQYAALKSYFAELAQVSLALKNDEGFRKRFNEAAAKADLNQVCSKIFVTKSKWQVMMDRCTRNRYFLCAEEVRANPDMIAAIRSQLVPDQRKRFDQAEACKTAL